VVALSGELSQKERSNALQAMRDGRARVCIATDVAARGIDLPNLELVIHADLPTNREALLHRSGRTGRAGRKGVSVLIVPHSARKRAERLLASADIRAHWGKPPSADEIIQRDNERILADAALSEPVQEEEQDMVSELLARYGAEQIAAALVRRYRAGQSAPEELLDAGPAETKKRERGGFENSVWMSVSVGRKQNAEPRWLLPMLCKAGGITKREIGVIKMQDRETYVQLAADHADRFFKTIGPDGRLENNIWVKRLDDAPGDMSAPAQGRARSDERPERPRKAYEERPRKPYEGRKVERPEKAETRKAEDRSEAKRFSRPRGKPVDKSAYAVPPAAESRPDHDRFAAPASGKPPKKQSKSRLERRARRAAEREAKAAESGDGAKVASSG
jgi:ATP-dependent RNA helicase DeaD